MRTWMRPVAIVLFVALLLLALWSLYDLGKLHGVVELESLRSEHTVLKKRYAALLENSESRARRLAVFERSARIDRQAAEDVKNELAGLEKELQAAREEVEFYRGIVAPGSVQSGLRIHRFRLESDARPGRYTYNLVLTQLKQNRRTVSGVVDWKISGYMQEAPDELGLAEVTQPPVDYLDFRFRYFQSLSGEIILPDGFDATQVALTIRPSGGGIKSAVQVFDWPDG